MSELLDDSPREVTIPEPEIFETPALKQLRNLFAAAADGGVTEKRLKGPHYTVVEGILKELIEAGRTFYPGIQPVDLGDEASLEGVNLTLAQRDGLRHLRGVRQAALCAMGRRLGGDLPDVTILPSRLTVPPLHGQGVGAHEAELRGCAIACFRMMHESFTKEQLNHQMIARVLQEIYGHYQIESEEYVRFFLTPEFQAAFGLEMDAISLTGGDLATIAAITEKLKGRNPQLSVVCLIDLQSALTKYDDSWHTVILLSSNGPEVTVRNPSGKGDAFQSISKKEFYERWALAFNRAHLVIGKKRGSVP